MGMIILSLDRLNGKDVLLVGGNESIGVPCAVRGKNKQGFLKITSDFLKSSNVNVETVDFFSMVINKNWHISEILKHNLSLEEIKMMQQKSIRIKRKDLFGKLYFPSGIEKIYEVKPDDSNKHITDMIKEHEKVLTVYQSGANNLMYEMQSNPISAVIDKKARKRALDAMKDESVIKRVGSGMTKNIRDLLSINNDMEIYMLSLYVPKLFEILSHDNDDFKLMIDFINRFNRHVQFIACGYGATYVDITPIGKYCAKGGVDFHCTKDGNQLLASILVNEISIGPIETQLTVINKNMNMMNRYNFTQDNTGLSGMLKDANNRYHTYNNALESDGFDDTILRSFSPEEQKDLCKSLQKEHYEEMEVLDNAKRSCL